MSYYNLVEDSSGILISGSFDPITPQAGQVVIVTANRDGTWNSTTRVYDPYTVKRIVSTPEFITRFTELEQEDLVEASKTIKKAATFLKILPIIGQADLDSGFIINSVNGMETAGIIEAGRAAVILSD